MSHLGKSNPVPRRHLQPLRLQARSFPGEVRWACRAFTSIRDPPEMHQNPSLMASIRAPRLEAPGSSAHWSWTSSPAKELSVCIIRCPQPFFLNLPAPYQGRPPGPGIANTALSEAGSSIIDW